MKRLFFLFTLLSTLVLVACTSDEPITDPNNPSDDPNDKVIELTLEELAYYDGTDNKPAYIEVEGKIYDVTILLFGEMVVIMDIEQGKT